MSQPKPGVVVIEITFDTTNGQCVLNGPLHLKPLVNYILDIAKAFNMTYSQKAEEIEIAPASFRPNNLPLKG